MNRIPIFLLLFSASLLAEVEIKNNKFYKGGEVLSAVELPAPSMYTYPFERILKNRDSEVSLSDADLTISQISQIFWAGYGTIRKQSSKRTVFSHDQANSLLVYLVTDEGAYVYIPADHSLGKVVDTDIRSKLALAARRDKRIYVAQASIVIAGSPKRAGYKRSRNSRKYMLLEAGRVAQNMEIAALLQGLGFIHKADISEMKISYMLKMPSGFEPISILTVGELEEPLEFADNESRQPENDKPSDDKSAPEDEQEAATLKNIEQKGEKADKKQAQKTKKALLFIPPNNYAERIYVEVSRLLTASGVEVDLASTTRNAVRGDQRGRVSPDYLISSARPADYDVFIVLSSNLGSRDLRDNRQLANAINEAYNAGIPIGAFDRAIELIAESGVLNGGVSVTGEPSVRRVVVRNGGNYVNEPIVIDRGIITAKSGRDTSLSSIEKGATGVAGFTAAIMELLNQ